MIKGYKIQGGINNPRYQLILEETKNIWYHFIILVLANSLLVWPSIMLWLAQLNLITKPFVWPDLYPNPRGNDLSYHFTTWRDPCTCGAKKSLDWYILSILKLVNSCLFSVRIEWAVATIQWIGLFWLKGNIVLVWSFGSNPDMLLMKFEIK